MSDDPIQWDDVVRRIAGGEPVADVLDEKFAADRAAFRAHLADMGAPGANALRRYDADMQDLDTGITGARAAWHSISPAQRRALIESGEGKPPAARMISTLRNLASRDLIAWDGVAFAPESKTVITERGQFVLAHGRS